MKYTFSFCNISHKSKKFHSFDESLNFPRLMQLPRTIFVDQIPSWNLGIPTYESQCAEIRKQNSPYMYPYPLDQNAGCLLSHWPQIFGAAWHTLLTSQVCHNQEKLLPRKYSQFHFMAWRLNYASRKTQDSQNIGATSSKQKHSMKPQLQNQPYSSPTRRVNRS